MAETRAREGASDRVAAMTEARAIEETGGQWRLRHVAAITGYSESFLRRSDCPRFYDISGGSTTKAAIWYEPAEVREWKAARLSRAEARPRGA